MTAGAVRVSSARAPADFALAEALIREYLEMSLAVLGISAGYQGIDDELAGLDVMYGPPRGAALLAWLDGVAVGFVGLRPMGEAGDAELKRMYVRPAARGAGAGRALTLAAVAEAGRLGYRRVVLDTVARLEEASGLYRSVGFVDIPPYRYNPYPDARYLALEC